MIQHVSVPEGVSGFNIESTGTKFSFSCGCGRRHEGDVNFPFRSLCKCGVFTAELAGDYFNVELTTLHKPVKPKVVPNEPELDGLAKKVVAQGKLKESDVKKWAENLASDIAEATDTEEHVE